MKKSKKQLEKELLQIQKEKEEFLLSVARDKNGAFIRLFGVSLNRNHLTPFKYILFVLVSIPLFFFYFNEFFLPISKYENYQLTKEINQSLLEIEKTKLELDRQKKDFEYLYSQSEKFSDSIISYTDLTFRLNYTILLLQQLKEFPVTEESLIIAREELVSYLHQDEYLINSISEKNSILGNQFLEDELLNQNQILNMLARVDLSLNIIIEKYPHIKTDLLNHQNSIYLSTIVILLDSQNYLEFSREINQFNSDLITILITNSMTIENVFVSYRQKIDNVISQKN
jgi:hypothetical protein